MPAKEKKSGSSTVQSVERAISILESVAAHGSVGVSAVAADVGLHKTTVFRILSTLEARGMVAQASERGDYSIGFTVYQLSVNAVRTPDLVTLTRAPAAELAAEVNETVHLSVLEDGESVTVDQVAGTSAIGSIDWIGRRAPLHATAAGKVLLAHVDPVERDRLLGRELTRFTERTVTDRRDLEAELTTVSRDGIAFSNEEHELGLVAVGAPIRRLDSTVVASLTVSGPSFRITPDALPVLATSIREAADRVSRSLGWSPRRDR